MLSRIEFACAAILLAAVVLAYGRGGWFILGFFSVAAFLDIIGTGLAAYMLDGAMLVGLMVVCLIGWLWRFVGYARTGAVAP